MTDLDQDRMLKAALAYVQRLRWAVFPCAGKVPAIRGGRGCLDASSDPAVVRRWWGEQYRGANIGVAAGDPSGFWVLDVDGEEGEETLAELTRLRGSLPETVEQLTGGGGRHLLFVHAGEAVRNAVRFAPGLDVRTTGGYIVVAPSTHPVTGRRYCWEVSARPIDTPLSPAPTWLVEAVTAKRSAGGERHAARPAPATSLPAKPADDRPAWLARACGVVPEGKRNDTLARLTGHLMRRCDPMLAATLAVDWNARHCQPPLPDDEVFRTIESIAGAELRRLASRRRRSSQREQR